MIARSAWYRCSDRNWHGLVFYEIFIFWLKFEKSSRAKKNSRWTKWLSGGQISNLEKSKIFDQKYKLINI